MTLNEAKSYINRKANLFGEIVTIKEITQCGNGSDLIVAHFDNGSASNIVILKDVETGKFLGE